jgi:hypothetical protein
MSKDNHTYVHSIDDIHGSDGEVYISYAKDKELTIESESLWFFLPDLIKIAIEQKKVSNEIQNLHIESAVKLLKDTLDNNS